MKTLGASAVLGLTLTERTIVAAEVRMRGDGGELRRAAEFVIPPELSIQAPGPLGDALRHFLRQNHFSVARAVVGIPARWLLAQEKEIPPASAAVAASVLRLQAERQIAMEPQDLVFDYVGEPDSSKPRKVLLVAMLKDRLERIQQMAEAAGLSLLAVTSSTLALAQASVESAGGPLLALTADAVELAVRSEGRTHLLRHLPSMMGAQAAADGPAFVGGEVRRAMALMPQNGGPAPRQLYLWDAMGLSSEAAASLGERAGLEVRSEQDLTGMRLVSSPRVSGSTSRYAAAAALALAGGRGELLAFDFLHSRLTVRSARRFGRRSYWAALAAIALMGSGAWLGLNIHQHSSHLAELKSQLADMQPAVKAAQAAVDKVTVADEWYHKRSAPLDCLKEIALAFPEEGRIWSTSVSLREAPRTTAGKTPDPKRVGRTYNGTVGGKAVDQPNVLNVLERMQKNKRFFDVGLQNMGDAGGTARETQFSISFSFGPVE